MMKIRRIKISSFLINVKTGERKDELATLSSEIGMNGVNLHFSFAMMQS